MQGSTVSDAGDKQVNVGKMQIKGVTMITTQGSSSPGTCHTDISVENKEHEEDLPECRTFKEPRGGWEGTNRRRKEAIESYSKETMRANLRGDDSMCMHKVITH